MDPIPYNITIPSQTASIQYSPTRDGAIDAGWNVTYPSGLAPNAGTQQGVGADFHQTTHDGATLQLSFTGTAIYLYGQATSASFTVAIDGKGSDSTAVTIPQGGLLAAQTGLTYGSHTVTLTTHGTGLVAFQYAELTIGVGYPGSSVQNRTVYAVDPNNGIAIPDSFFTFQTTQATNSWTIESQMSSVQSNGSSVQIPRQMATSVAGESVTFTLNQTSAFFLRGTVNRDHGPKTVTFTPQSNPSQIKTTIINDYSSVLSFASVLYWESGLDRNQTYTVQITQLGGPSQPTGFSFSELDIIDGGSPVSGSSGGSGGGSPSNPDGRAHDSKAASLSPAAIIGICAAAFVVGLTLLIVGSFYWLRKRRGKDTRYNNNRGQGILEEDSRDDLVHGPGSATVPMVSTAYMVSTPYAGSFPYGTSTPAGSVIMHESDAGPASMDIERLPPQYQNSWVPSSPSGRDTFGDTGDASTVVTSRVPPRDEKRQLVVMSYDDGMSTNGS